MVRIVAIAAAVVMVVVRGLWLKERKVFGAVVVVVVGEVVEVNMGGGDENIVAIGFCGVFWICFAIIC